MNEPDNRLSIDFSGLKLNDADVDEETWLCDVSEEPACATPTTAPSTDRANQSSNELIEWLQGSTQTIDYRTRSALSRRIRNHASKKEKAKLKSPTVDKLTDLCEEEETPADFNAAPIVQDQLVLEEDEEDEFFDAREDFSDSFVYVPLVPLTVR
uniref:Uncharacterized protein n=1 Tax=Steinernema glaseri TaxID=37863 RepID=A0A1I7YE26_9BILA